MPSPVAGAARASLWAWLLRLLGIVLLGFLLARLDLGQVYAVMRGANPLLIVAAMGAIPLLILVKTVRWRGVLRAQGVHYRTGPAFLAYFGSLFVGLLTPGRLGEFVKTVHVSQECGVSTAHAFSSVLVDRLFDLGLLLIVGGMALLALGRGSADVIAVGGAVALLAVPLALFLNDTAFSWLQRIGLKLGALGRKLFAAGGWVVEMRLGLRRLAQAQVAIASAWTALAYALFFGQCYLLALALGLGIGFWRVSFAVSLGSLVALLPVSVAGLGSREAAIVAYLGAAGVPSEGALSFSLLVFLSFHVASGLMGAVAWWIKPVDLGQGA